LHKLSGLTATSVSEEKKFNPRLTKSKEEFVKLMDNLNLAYPAKIGKPALILLFILRNALQIEHNVVYLWRV
jgi:sulfur dioxygenase